MYGRLEGHFGFAVLFALLISLVGCTKEERLSMQFGEPIPSVRFHVRLYEPMTEEEFRAKGAELALAGGLIPADANSPESLSLDFFETRSDSAWQLNLGFASVETVNDMIVEFDVKLVYGSMERFDEEDWLLFKKWRDQLLPAALPSATVTVITHPVEFTESARIADIASITGIEVPEPVGKVSPES